MCCQVMAAGHEGAAGENSSLLIINHPRGRVMREYPGPQLYPPDHSMSFPGTGWKITPNSPPSKWTRGLEYSSRLTGAWKKKAKISVCVCVRACVRVCEGEIAGAAYAFQHTHTQAHTCVTRWEQTCLSLLGLNRPAPGKIKA